jgi:hypothetical protein
MKPSQANFLANSLTGYLREAEANLLNSFQNPTLSPQLGRPHSNPIEILFRLKNTSSRAATHLVRLLPFLVRCFHHSRVEFMNQEWPPVRAVIQITVTGLCAISNIPENLFAFDRLRTRFVLPQSIRVVAAFEH